MLAISDAVTIAALSTLGVIVAALCTIGVAMVQTSRRAAHAATKAAQSVGDVNGHGTVQDATGLLIGEVRALRTSVEAILDTADHVSARLKQHDREHAATNRRLQALEEAQ